MKFLHVAGALGLMGGLAAYIMVLMAAPEITAIEQHLALRTSLAFVASWLITPSMALVLVTGLLAMAVHYPFMNMPWVWIKALTGVLIFETTLASLDGPADAAKRAAERAVAGEIDASEFARLVHDEYMAWWILLGLALINVALAIWRPRFRRVFR